MSKHELYDKFLTDSLNEEEEKELLKILEDDEKSEKFTNYIIETNMMVSAAENCKTAEFQTQKSKAEVRSLYMIAAAMIALGLFLYFKPVQKSYEIISSNIELYENGSFTDEKVFSFEDGLVTIKSPNGNLFQLKGPVRLELQSENMLTLSKGSLITTLDPNTEEFILNVPTGKIKDLGTSFGTLIKDLNTEVHVFTGKVEVSSKLNSKRLLEGESVSFDSDGHFIEIPFRKDIFDLKEADVIFMGDRELHPGEQLELILDSAGRQLKAKLSLKYDDQKKFKYKVQAYSKSKMVFESQVYSADENYEVEIPTIDSKELTIEMKVVEGNVSNGRLQVKGLELITEGHRPYEGEMLIKSNSEWSYLFNQNPTQNWMSKDFDDSNWFKGITSIGFGDSDLKTKIGGDELKKTVSKIFFRHKFELGNLELNSLKKLKLNLLADDGALIFINGREATRYNLPEGPINLETRAMKIIRKEDGEMIYNNFSIPSHFLRPGKNIVNVILFQREGQSSDMRFDLQMIAF
ncbi:MAG: FecR domain-containing protein [Lentisphaeraceae bacterium]|nr:FecR domain-containing protein [Lentisphaeraceae bacterium]